METVRLNIGGVSFKCYTKILQRYKGSLLSILDETSEHFDTIENEYFFDRNPIIFHFILDAYRTGNLHMPKNICGVKFKEELEFWGLSESLVSQCCWEPLYTSENNVSTIQTLATFYEQSEIDITNRDGARKKIWQFLNEPKSSKLAKAWGVFMTVLIIVSVLVFAVESVSSVRSDAYTEEKKATLMHVAKMLTDNNTDSTLYGVILLKPHILITIIDTLCFVVLSVELIVVFCVYKNKSDFVKCWLRMSEAICSAAFWVFFILEKRLENIESVHLMRVMIVCKHLTILKLVRLFRVAKHISELQILGLTMSVSRKELGVLVLMLFILTSLFGTLIYWTEAAETETFGNVFMGMYWALVTLTTVGYGKYVPITTAGHIVACTCSVCGVIILALPIGIFASNFNNFYHHNQYVSVHMRPNVSAGKNQQMEIK